MALVESQFSYSYPPISVVSNGAAESWVTRYPTSGSVFRSDSNSVISFTLDSSNAFANLFRSYLKYTVIPRAADGTIAGAGVTITSAGLGAGVFQRVRILLGGAEIESLDNYPAISTLLNNQASPERKRILKALESYGNTTALGGKRTVVHPINSSFFMQKSATPLPVISNGGLTVELTLASADKLMTSFGSAGATYFTVENASFNVHMCTPSAQYVQRIMSGLEQGRALYIPYVQCRSFLSYGSGGAECDVNLQIGNVTSLQGIAARFVTEADYSTQSVDKALISGDGGLRSWYVQIGSKKEPQARDFQHSLEAATYDPETLAVRLFSAYNSYEAGEAMDLDIDNLTKQFLISINFKDSTEVFSNGYALTVGDGSVRLHTTHAAPVSANTRIETVAFIDTILEIQRDIIIVNQRF